MVKTSPAHARYKVWERDHGVCAICKQDSVAGQVYKNGRQRENRPHGTGDLWQADHVQTVAEGGGECGLSNLRTLCTKCHIDETRALHARLRKKRYEAKPLPLFDDGAHL